MRIICIVQARIGSQRLPGKVIMKGASEKPLILNLYERINKSKFLNNIIIATTNLREDLKIVRICKKNNIPCFKGSNLNVLYRYYKCALKYKADVILRVTADCPLLDYKFIDNFISKYLEKKNINYLSNTFPNRSVPKGYDLEIFDFTTLKKSAKNAKTKYDKEHVTSYIKKNHKKFRVLRINFKNSFKNYRLTLDYIEDYILIKNIFDTLYRKNKYFSLKDVIEYLKKNKISKVNKIYI